MPAAFGLSDLSQALLEYAAPRNPHKFIIITIIMLIEHDLGGRRGSEDRVRQEERIARPALSLELDGLGRGCLVASVRRVVRIDQQELDLAAPRRRPVFDSARD